MRLSRPTGWRRSAVSIISAFPGTSIKFMRLLFDFPGTSPSRVSESEDADREAGGAGGGTESERLLDTRERTGADRDGQS